MHLTHRVKNFISLKTCFFLHRPIILITLLLFAVWGADGFSEAKAVSPAAGAVSSPAAITPLPGFGGEPGKSASAAGVSFPVHRSIGSAGKACPAKLTGTGIRTFFLFKIYAGAHYIEQDHSPSGDPYDWLGKGRFCKECVMHFLMGVKKEKMRDEFRNNIAKNLGENELAELAPEVERLVSFFSEDVSRGTEIAVSWVPGTGMTVFVNNEFLGTIESERIMEAIWSFWFGPRPISGKLKRNLAKELVTK